MCLSNGYYLCKVVCRDVEQRHAGAEPLPERGQAGVVEAAELGEVGGRGVRRLQLPGRARRGVRRRIRDDADAALAGRHEDTLGALAQAGGLPDFGGVRSAQLRGVQQVVSSVLFADGAGADRRARRDAQRRRQQQREYCENHPSPCVWRNRTRG